MVRRGSSDRMKLLLLTFSAVISSVSMDSWDHSMLQTVYFGQSRGQIIITPALRGGSNANINSGAHLMSDTVHYRRHNLHRICRRLGNDDVQNTKATLLVESAVRARLLAMITREMRLVCVRAHCGSNLRDTVSIRSVRINKQTSPPRQ